MEMEDIWHTLHKYVFLGWAAALAVATAVQFRFMNSFSVAFAVLLAVTVVPWVVAFFRTRARTLGVRAVSIFVLVGVVLYAVAPIARAQEVHIRNLQAWALGEPVRPFYLARLQIVREHMARWLRGNSEPTAEGLFNGPQPEYAILAPWSVGHVLKYVAERPVLHDNFGVDVAPENMQRVQRYFAAEEESEALALIEGIPVRYVIVRDPESARLRERRAFGMENRLFGFRGSGKWVMAEGGTTAPRQVKALERHRLVYESVPLRGKVGEEEPLYRVFEIVPGAQIIGRSLPREVVTARLSVGVRNRSGFEYQVRTRADEEGRWAMRVPYANDGSVPGVDVGAFYTVEARSGSARVRIPEALVREGGTLEAPPLRAPSASSVRTPAAIFAPRFPAFLGRGRFGWRGDRGFRAVLAKVGRADRRKITEPLGIGCQGFDDGYESVHLELEMRLRKVSHLVFDLDPHAFSDSVEDHLFRGYCALGDLDLVDVLQVLEVSDIQPRDQ